MLETARILVVDDEKIIREGCSRILRKAGHGVETAADGAEALEMIRKDHFDMVLLDIKMPEIDGMEVMHVLNNEAPDVLILVITGYATIETAVDAMKAGAYDLLIKPFSADALRIAVGRALDHLGLAAEMEELRQERERSLRDIANEQSRVKTIMNAMAAGILVTDDENNLVLYNPVAAQMLDCELAARVGRPISEVLDNEELIEMIGQFGDAHDAEYSALEHEITIGRSMYLRARAAPVKDADDRFIGAVTVLQDVTHMKEMERMKSEFVTMVSHELKAPLAAIQQQLDVLLGGMAGEVNDKQAHFLSRAQTRAQGLVDLINELLDLSRIESGRLVSEQEPLDLAPVIAQIVDFVRPQAEAKQQELVLRSPESLPKVSADPRNMDEVFINIINNAIKYTPEGGRIEVVVETSGDNVRISISDTGYGIPKEDLHRIFDRFYRVKSDKTKSISGTGLGLPIVKAIVEAHLGSIKVDSTLGSGAVFVVTLPLLAQQKQNRAAG